MRERLGIAGAGAIASGLAAVAAVRGDVALWARSDASAQRAEAAARRIAAKLDGGVERPVRVGTDPTTFRDRTVVVEAIAEHLDAKSDLLRRLDALLAPEAILGTTTSS